MAAVDRNDDMVLRRAWIRKALELQRSALIRSRAKEMVGSDIYNLRTKEIEFLDNMIKEY